MVNDMSGDERPSLATLMFREVEENLIHNTFMGYGPFGPMTNAPGPVDRIMHRLDKIEEKIDKFLNPHTWGTPCRKWRTWGVDESVLLPRSQIAVIHRSEREGYKAGEVTVTVPMWLAAKEGMV